MTTVDPKSLITAATVVSSDHLDVVDVQVERVRTETIGRDVPLPHSVVLHCGRRCGGIPLISRPTGTVRWVEFDTCG